MTHFSDGLQLGLVPGSSNVSLTTSGTEPNVSLTIAPAGTGGVAVTGTVSLAGASGSEALRAVSVANAVNRVHVTPTVSGGGIVTMAAIGADTNIDLAITPKGAGLVRVGTATVTATTAASFSATRYITIKDASGTTVYVPCATSAW